MTLDEKISIVKTMISDSDVQDNLIDIYLEIARMKIIERLYPYSQEIKLLPEKYDLLQCEIAQYLINKRGAEGQTAHSENGIQRVYESSDVPDSMLRGVVPHCGVIK